MRGFGIIIDAVAVAAAGSAGMLFRGKLKVAYQELVVQGCGFVALCAGIAGAWDALFVMGEGRFEVWGTALVLLSLAVGFPLGIACRAERLPNRLGEWFLRLADARSSRTGRKAPARGSGGRRSSAARKGGKSRKPDALAAGKGSAAAEDPGAAAGTAPGGRRKWRALSEMPVYLLPSHRSGQAFGDGLAAAVALVAAGSFGFRAVAADLSGDMKLMWIKTALDAALVFALTTAYGEGVPLAAVPLLAIEGAAALLLRLTPFLMTADVVCQLSFIGAVIMIGEGINLSFGKRFRVLNFLPGLLVPPLYLLLMRLFTAWFAKG